MARLFFALVLTCLHIVAQAEITVVSHAAPEARGDVRSEYDVELLRLSLEITKDTFGDYRLIEAPSMNFRRQLRSIKTQAYPNLVVKSSYNKTYTKDEGLDYIKFPIELGIVGLRVCFVAKRNKEKFSNIKSIEDLKGYTIGQGLGWSDTTILRHNGLDVLEVSEYASLFKMVDAARIDLFCRGVNEVLPEQHYADKYYNIELNESFLLSYPLPRFYYTHKSNTKIIKRIETGIKKAYEQGLLQDLWDKHYLASVEYSKLKKRTIISLDNPLLDDVYYEYSNYFYFDLENFALTD